MMFKKTLLAAAVFAVGGATSAFAGTSPQSATFQVTATVIKSCVITTAPISFGNYDPTSGTAMTATGTVKAQCTKGSVVAVALDQGLWQAAGSTAAIPARQMKDPVSTNLLPYNIYIAGTGTTEWGNTTAQEPVTQTSTSAKAASALTFTTYGSLPAGADVSSGSYADTVTATLTF